MLEPTRAKGIRLQHHEDVQTYGRQRVRVGADKDQHEVVEVLDWTGCKNTKIRFVVQSKFNDLLQLPDEACIIIMALLAFLAYIWLSTLCLSEFPIGLFT